MLSPCRAVHMFGLRFPLDVIFLDRDGVVVATYPGLRPRRITRWHSDAEHALEVPSGVIEASHTRPGDRLAWTPAELEFATPAQAGSSEGSTR